MDEYVGPAGVRLNKAEALRCIEPFHRARRHDALLSNRPTNLAEPPFIARRGGRQSALWLFSGRPKAAPALGNDAIRTCVRGEALDPMNKTDRDLGKEHSR